MACSCYRLLIRDTDGDKLWAEVRSGVRDKATVRIRAGLGVGRGAGVWALGVVQEV